MSAGRRIDIRIDRLVLEGISPLDRSRVVAAIERELRRLAAEERLPVGTAGSFGVGGAPASTLAASAGGRPDRIGAEVAKSIWAAGRRAVLDGAGGEPQPPPSGRTNEGGES